MLRHLYQILQQRSQRWPNAVALGAEEGLRWRTVTSVELLSLVDTVADDLAARGIGAGDRVVLWSPSGIRTPVYLFAIWKLGAVVVPFDKDMNPQAARAIIEAVEPKAVILGFDQQPAWAPPNAIEWWEPAPRPTSSSASLPEQTELPPQPSTPSRMSRVLQTPQVILTKEGSASRFGAGVADPSQAQDDTTLDRDRNLAPQRSSTVEGPRSQPTGSSPLESSTTPHQLGAAGAKRSERSAVASEELAAIFFTSGTTGQPKGCMITHANLCSQIEVFDDRIPLDETCRLASILPLSHLFELTCGLLYPLLRGAAVHYIPGRRGSDIVRVLKDQRVTHMMAVPQLLTLMGNALEHRLKSRLPASVYRALLSTADRAPVALRRHLFFLVHRQIGGHLRLLAAGGAALPMETQRLWERLGVDVVQGYGTSECSPVVACGEPRKTPPGSVGRPLKNVEVRLSPESELLVRGPNVTRGYWRDPRRTAEVLSAEGWYATGDLASIDQRGNIWLRGRARDLIVLPNGMNVWPEDVEDALRREPRIRDAAVVAVSTPNGRMKLHAYLIGDGAAARSTEIRSLLARVNSRLAMHQRVATASWWAEPDFPRTSTLKVRRHLLPTAVPDIADDSAPPLEGDPVAECVAAAAHVTSVRDEHTLAQVGLDSLGLVELAAQLEEKTGRALAESALSTEMTVADLRVALSSASVVDNAAGGDLDGAGRMPMPAWFYRYGWPLRPILTAPFDLIYALGIPRTIVLGAEHLRGLPATVVFAGNHRSFADMPLVRVGLSRTPARRFARRLVIAAMAEGEGWQSPLARYVAAGFGLYPLDRLAHREASLRRLASLAGGGNAVLIFPQGAHAHPADERGDPPAVRFKTGVVHVAEALDAPVVPFGLAGTEEAMPPFLDDFHGLVVGGVPVAIRRTVLAIAFGPPERPNVGETAQQFAERLERTSYALAAAADKARRQA